MRRASLHRADLLRALAGAPKEERASLAAALGFEEQEDMAQGSEGQVEKAPDQEHPPGQSQASLAPLDLDAPRVDEDSSPMPFPDVPFWLASRLERTGEMVSHPKRGRGLRLDELAGRGPHRDRSTPPTPAEVPWSVQGPRLRRVLTQGRRRRAVDVARAVHLASKLVVYDRLPRLPQRRISDQVHLVVDHDVGLRPLEPDREELILHLQRELGVESVEISSLRHGPLGPWVDRGARGFDCNERLLPMPTLILGDLGILQWGTAQERWLELGRAWSRAGVRPVALVPLRLSEVPDALQRVYRVLPWEPELEPEDSEHAEEERVKTLLRWMSPSERAEPGLLRAVRKLLDLPGSSLGTEIRVWNRQEDVLSDDLSMRVGEDWLEELPQAIEGQSRSLGPWVELMRHWHRHLPPELWHSVVLHLGRLLPGAADRHFAEDLGLAKDWLQRWCGSKESLDLAGFAASRRFFQSIEDHSGATIGHYGETLALWLACHEGEDLALAPGPIDLAEAARLLGRGSRVDQGILVQGSRGLRIDAAPKPNASPIACVDAINDGVVIQGQQGPSLLMRLGGSKELQVSPQALEFRGAATALFLEQISLQDLEWASAMGRDQHGLWAEFELAGVVQRMRWMPAGEFWMGSEEGEPGRYEDEGPRHRVSLSKGYWLAETACTQELWEAVMEANPSRFVDPRRPVEGVSYKGVMDFLARTEELAPGLDLRLPTEAEWEYGCRAGGTDDKFQGGGIFWGPTIHLRSTRLPGTEGTQGWVTSLRSMRTVPDGWRSSTSTSVRGQGE